MPTMGVHQLVDDIQNQYALVRVKNRKFKLLEIEPLIAKRLTSVKDTKLQDYSRLLRVTFTNTADIENYLLTSYKNKEAT